MVKSFLSRDGGTSVSHEMIPRETIPHGESNYSRIAPCRRRCPLGVDVPWLSASIANLPDDPDALAARLPALGDKLLLQNPFSPVCGYICGYCRKGCTPRDTGRPVRVRLLERFVGDACLRRMAAGGDKTYAHHKRTRKNVAIAGGGPAGLLCAWRLSSRGFGVTIFEKGKNPGGDLRLIPAYRLPVRVLDTNIDYILNSGWIKVETFAAVGPDGITLKNLREMGFDAAFIAVGAGAPRGIKACGNDIDPSDGITYAERFLSEVQSAGIVGANLSGKHVIVLGGGNIAMDAARSAGRFGAKVSVVCLEHDGKSGREALAADAGEVKAAVAEGIDFMFAGGVDEVVRLGGIFKGLRFSALDQPSNDGAFIEADTVVIAVGNLPDVEYLGSMGFLDDHGRLNVNPITMESQIKGVFVGGNARRVGYAVEAMAEGLGAARAIERYLTGGSRNVDDVEDEPRRGNCKEGVSGAPIKPGAFASHVEVECPEDLYITAERGFTPEEAAFEALRCAECSTGDDDGH